MPGDAMVITLMLDDQLTDEINKAKKAIDETADHIRQLGREVSQVGKNLTFFGAAITGSFVLAMKKAAETNDEVAKTFRQIDAASSKLNTSIATSLVPVMQTLTGILITVSNWWLGLSQGMRDFIVQATFVSGVVLIVGGSLTVIIGKLISLSSVVFSAIKSFALFATLNPVLLITAGIIGAILTLMIRFKGIADTVTSTFEVLFRFLYNGMLTVATVLTMGFKTVVDWLFNILDVLDKIPGPQQKLFENMANGLKSASDSASYFSNVGLQGIIDNSSKIGEIFRTGQGEWSNTFQIGIDKIGEFGNAFSNLNKIGRDSSTIIAKSWTETWNQAKNVLGQLGSALQGAAAQNKKYAVAAQAVSIGLAIMNVAEGVTAALKWGFPLGPIFAGIIAAAGAIQIATIASQSFAVGTSNVPYDMTAQIHKGEAIIPATFADSIRRGELSLSGGGGSGSVGDIQINLYGVSINSKENIRELAEELGFEIDRNLRNARSRI